MRILIVEDNQVVARQIKTALEQELFIVDVAHDGEEGWFLGDTEPYDAVILDLGLPKLDGLSLLQKWRQAANQVPVLILTSRDTWREKVTGLRAGADDYLAKPFNPRELLARVRAVLRRNWPETEVGKDVDGTFIFGAFILDAMKRVLYRDTAEVDLSRAEFDLLSVLVKHPNRVLSRDFIMECLGGNDRDPFDRSIDVRVTRLRHKIEDDPAKPKFVRT
ncbi:MAG: response regulator transcription factor, partial [Gammaproteobacteria bacterium]|nr:response regulator transcription factor [Gammaproteobacteria bacterium]